MGGYKWSMSGRDLFRPRVLELREKGLSNYEIGRRLGISGEAVRVYAMTETKFARYSEKQRERRRAYRAANGGTERVVRPHIPTNRKIREDAAFRMDEIPADTRDLTARLLGDPLPGRRALDKLPPRRLRALGVDAEAQ